MAEQIMEQAVGHNFIVKSSPTYYIVRAKALQSESKTEEAIKMLELAMKLPIFKMHDTHHQKQLQQSSSNKSGNSDERIGLIVDNLSLCDKVTLYILLADLKQEAGHIHPIQLRPSDLKDLHPITE